MEEIKNAVHNLQKQIEDLNMLLARVPEVGRNCLTCGYWNHKGDSCDKFKAKPPGSIIVIGCDDHDFIPF